MFGVFPFDINCQLANLIISYRCICNLLALFFFHLIVIQSNKCKCYWCQYISISIRLISSFKVFFRFSRTPRLESPAGFSVRATRGRSGKPAGDSHCRKRPLVLKTSRANRRTYCNFSPRLPYLHPPGGCNHSLAHCNFVRYNIMQL